MSGGVSISAERAAVSAAVSTAAFFSLRQALSNSAALTDAVSINVLKAVGLAGPPVLWLRMLLALGVQVLLAILIAVVIARWLRLDRGPATVAGAWVGIILNLVGLVPSRIG